MPRSKGFTPHHFFAKSGERGFTLLELLVVIAIIGVISSVVLVSMKGSTGKAKIAKSLEFSQTILNVAGIDAVGIWSFDEGSGGTAFDKSGYGNHGTITGATHVSGEGNTPHWFVNEGEGRSALKFEGSGYVNVSHDSSLNITDAITIEAWVKPGADGTQWIQLVGKGAGNWTISNWNYLVGLDNLRVRIVFAGALTTSSSISPDRWHYIVFTGEQGTTDALKIYIDGKLVREGNRSGDPPTNTNLLKIVGRNYLEGYMDEVRIYERALSSAEIQQHYAESAPRRQLAISDN